MKLYIATDGSEPNEERIVLWQVRDTLNAAFDDASRINHRSLIAVVWELEITPLYKVHTEVKSTQIPKDWRP